jgi:VWFA-related protein
VTFLARRASAVSRFLALPVLLASLATGALAAPVNPAQPAPAPSAPAADKTQRARALLDRVNAAGPPLTDAELAEVMDGLPTEQVDVSMVMLASVVVDKRGRPVRGLKARNFKVLEEGRSLPLAWFSEETDRPARLVLLLDTSGSMGTPLQKQRTRDALETLFWKFRSGDKLMMLSFAADGVQQHGDWTEEPFSLLDTAVALRREGRTAIIDALYDAAAQLPPAPGERQAIVLVTDGLDNSSEKEKADAVRAARSIGVPIYVVALVGEDRVIQEKRAQAAPLRPLREIARLTGGRFFLARDFFETDKAAVAIRKDLRHQYWLGFKPLRPPNGTYRPIKVEVDRKGLEVLARQGYE